MKKLILLTVAFALSISAKSQNGYYTEYCNDAKLIDEAKQWADSCGWSHNFTKATISPSVNIVSFYKSYKKNPGEWNALFNWLQTHDLLSMEKGKYLINGTSLSVSIQDSYNEPLEKRKSESHNKHIDFQYVVKGIEGFALLDHFTSKPNCEYNGIKDVIHYDYDAKRLKLIKSIPGTFNIFFPRDWHIAKVATDEVDQNIRVVVVKIDY